MSELLVVANRGPSVSLGTNGVPVVAPSAGGVAPSIQRALRSMGGGTWLCAAQRTDERTLARDQTIVPIDGVRVGFVGIPEEIQRAATGIVANQTLWFVNHALYDLSRRPVFDRHWHEAWDAYRQFNAAFAERIATEASEGATVVVNDYHLALVGADLARTRPDLRTVCFFHTPFAGPSELRVLPAAVRAELIGSLASFGAMAFHVPRWADAFRRCAAELEPSPVVVTVPLGVDAEGLLESARSPEVLERRMLEERLDGRQLVARSDRVELSKNLVRGFLAFAELLEREPQRRGGVVFAARVYASRTDLAEYLAYGNDLVRVTDQINERFAVGDRLPIELEIADDLASSLALLASSDVLLVNPVRDGMNLVAREGAIVNERDGTLLLSEEAGAFDEAGAHAIPIEPFDVSGTARAIAGALDMPAEERAARAAALKAAAPGLGPAAWLERVAAAARSHTG